MLSPEGQGSLTLNERLPRELLNLREQPDPGLLADSEQGVLAPSKYLAPEGCPPSATKGVLVPGEYPAPGGLAAVDEQLAGGTAHPR